MVLKASKPSARPRYKMFILFNLSQEQPLNSITYKFLRGRIKYADGEGKVSKILIGPKNLF